MILFTKFAANAHLMIVFASVTLFGYLSRAGYDSSLIY